VIVSVSQAYRSVTENPSIAKMPLIEEMFEKIYYDT
jgi:hypothetical protein